MSNADERYRARLMRATEERLTRATIKAIALRESLQAAIDALDELQRRLEAAKKE